MFFNKLKKQNQLQFLYKYCKKYFKNYECYYSQIPNDNSVLIYSNRQFYPGKRISLNIQLKDQKCKFTVFNGEQSYLSSKEVYEQVIEQTKENIKNFINFQFQKIKQKYNL